MKLLDKYNYRPDPQTVSIADAVKYQCISSFDCGGQLEVLQRSVEQMASTIGFLVEKMHEKKVLTDQEILDLLPSYKIQEE